MAKKFIFFFYFIFLISFVSATTLTMSPSQLDFTIDKNEVVCKTAKIKGSENLTVIGETRWAEKGYSERKLTSHNLSFEDLKLDINIPREINFSNSSNIDICIKGKKGNYHGILLYKIKDKPIQVGIWLNVSIGGEFDSQNKITGNSIKIEKNNENFSNILVIPAILLLVLLILLFRLRYKD